MTRYTFAEAAAAARLHWGFSLHRGGEMGDGKHDGRWDTCYSKTGFVLGGDFPGQGHGFRRYDSLAQVVAACGLAPVIAKARACAAPPA